MAPTIDSLRDAPCSTFVLVASDPLLDPESLELVDGGDGVSLPSDRLLSQEEVDARLAGERIVLPTDRYAPVDQVLAPVFRDEVQR